MSDCLWSFFYISAEFCHPIFLTVLLLCFFDCLSLGGNSAAEVEAGESGEGEE